MKGYVTDPSSGEINNVTDTTEQWSIKYEQGKGIQFNNNAILDMQEESILNGVIPGANASGFQSFAFGGLRYDCLSKDGTNQGKTPTSAEGNQSFAFGGSTHAYGHWSSAFGKDAIAYQKCSVAFSGCQAGMTEEEFNAWYWDAENNVPLHGGDGKDSAGNILEYNGDTYSNSYSFAFAAGGKALGRSSCCFGADNIVYGSWAAAFGRNNNVYGNLSLTIGQNNTIFEDASRSLAVGRNNEISNIDSLAIGAHNKVSGKNSFAIGKQCIASGSESSAIGEQSQSTNWDAHAIGQFIINSSKHSVVVGRYNSPYTRAIFSVGVGTSEEDRKNGLVVEQARIRNLLPLSVEDTLAVSGDSVFNSIVAVPNGYLNVGENASEKGNKSIFHTGLQSYQKPTEDNDVVRKSDMRIYYNNTNGIKLAGGFWFYGKIYEDYQLQISWPEQYLAGRSDKDINELTFKDGLDEILKDGVGSTLFTETPIEIKGIRFDLSYSGWGEDNGNVNMALYADLIDDSPTGLEEAYMMGYKNIPMFLYKKSITPKIDTTYSIIMYNNLTGEYYHSGSITAKDISQYLDIREANILLLSM